MGSAQAYMENESHPANGNASSSSCWIPYCYAINYVLGVGVLSLPYGFARTGWLLGVVLTLVVSFFAWLCVNWVCEIMARAEAVTAYEEARSKNALAEQPLLLQRDEESLIERNKGPRCRITNRKFEFVCLCRIFLGQRYEKLYMFFFVFNFVAALWSLGIVFSSSMASNLGVPFVNAGRVCDVEKDLSDGCQSLYLFYLCVFSPIAVFLACLELREQKVLQVSLSILRFVVMVAMISTSIVGILTKAPDSLADPASLPGPPYMNGRKSWDASGILTLAPLVVYANILAHSVPGISHTMPNKDRLGVVYRYVFLTIFLGYSVVSGIVSLYYGTTVDRLCTLTWRNGHSYAVLANTIIMFPAIDAFSCFPLMSVTFGNNLMSLFLSKPEAANRYVTVGFRLLASVPPLIAAAFVRNIDNVLTWCGLFALQIAFTFPCVLQYASTKRCRELFGTSGHRTRYTGFFSTNIWIGTGLAFAVIAVVLVFMSSVQKL